MLGVFPLGPVMDGMGLNVTIMSYRGVLYWGLMARPPRPSRAVDDLATYFPARARRSAARRRARSGDAGGRGPLDRTAAYGPGRRQVRRVRATYAMCRWATRPGPRTPARCRLSDALVRPARRMFPTGQDRKVLPPGERPAPRSAPEEVGHDDQGARAPGLYVRDVDTSAAFYRDMLGWRQVLPDDGGPGAVGGPAFSRGRTHHELLLIEVGEDARRSRGTPHRLVPLRLEGGRHRRRAGAALAPGAEAGATVVGSSDHTVTHSLYIEDPDGNEIELYVDVPGVDWKTDPSLFFARADPPARPLSARPGTAQHGATGARP